MGNRDNISEITPFFVIRTTLWGNSINFAVMDEDTGTQIKKYLDLVKRN